MTISQIIKNSNWKKLILELIVVFLGVTAGFLLNNWQIQNQDEWIEQKYLLGFHQDVIDNISMLEDAVNADSLWLENAKPKLLSIQNGSITLDSANAVLKQIAAISKIEKNTGTYEDIINSGNLNIIRDYNLKKQIVEYYLAIAGVDFIDDYFYQYFSDFVMPFIFSNFSVLKGTLSDPEIRKSTRFANVVAGYFSMIQQRKKAYKDLLDKSYALRDELKKVNLISD